MPDIALFGEINTPAYRVHISVWVAAFRARVRSVAYDPEHAPDQEPEVCIPVENPAGIPRSAFQYCRGDSPHRPRTSNGAHPPPDAARSRNALSHRDLSADRRFRPHS